jgi:hypothetical protein
MINVVFNYPDGTESNTFSLSLEEIQAIKLADDVLIDIDCDSIKFDFMSYSVKCKTMNIWLKEL